MGLALSVGENDHFSEDLAALSGALAAVGVTWHEPGAVTGGGASAGFPYSYLHHVRRAYALHLNGEPVPPSAATSPERLARDAEVVEDETSMLASHLLCHSDCAGFYVPVEFDDPLFLDEDAVAGGGMVGSTQRLLAELLRCAPAIGIAADAGGLGPEQEALLADVPADDPYEAEKFTWYGLYRACRASIATGHALVFC
ncbi:hypothetical protein ACGFX4_23245 [Kitasatospora sp. NPDC048365]|uniref:hypothetical protein n=1 Tax=Kitasatospora sp. NPDC048365 TaxID=3364050 RepID=UPI003714BC23